MEQFREELEMCGTCNKHRLVRPTMLEVAVHFRERHRELLDTLDDAITLSQAVSLGMVAHG